MFIGWAARRESGVVVRSDSYVHTISQEDLMRTWTLLGLSACLLLAAACAPAPTGEPESAVGKVEDPSAIVGLRQAYETAYNAGDAAALAALWASDGIMMRPNAAAIEGGPAIQAFYEGQFQLGKAEVSISGDEAVMSGNWGFERGAFSLKLTMTDGSTLEDQGKFISIMTRQPDGSVNLSRLIFNSNLPVPGAPGA
jgi:ketosteroid isomerase-like protein